VLVQEDLVLAQILSQLSVKIPQLVGLAHHHLATTPLQHYSAPAVSAQAEVSEQHQPHQPIIAPQKKSTKSNFGN
jgi:hypothetical protein